MSSYHLHPPPLTQLLNRFNSSSPNTLLLSNQTLEHLYRQYLPINTSTTVVTPSDPRILYPPPLKDRDQLLQNMKNMKILCGGMPPKKKLRALEQTETKYVQGKEGCGIERGVLKKT